MNFKKFLSLILVSILTLSLLVSCAPPIEEEPKPSGSESSKDEEVKPTGKELEFFGQKDEVVDLMNELLKDFTKETGIPVVFNKVPDSETVLLTRLASNDVPDIMNTYPAETRYKEMYDSGYLLDLSDQPFLDRIEKTMLELSDYNGVQFSLPITLSSYGLYYNKDMFEEHGQKAPVTYDEFLAVCKYFKDKDITPLSIGLKSGTSQMLERFSGVVLNDNYLEFTKIAKGEIEPKDSKTLVGLGNLLEDVAEYTSEDVLSIEYQDAFTNFGKGETAMVISGTWALAVAKKANPNLNAEMIAMPTPTKNYETKIPVNIDTAYSVAKGDNQENAIKVLEFLVREDIAQRYVDSEGTPNMVKGVKYDVVEHALVSQMMTDGKMFLTAVNFWPPGLREDLQQPAQQLFLDHLESKVDIDSYVKASGEIILNRADEFK